MTIYQMGVQPMFESMMKKVKKEAWLWGLVCAAMPLSTSAQINGTISIRGQIVSSPCMIQTTNNEANMLCTRNGEKHIYSLNNEHVSLAQNETIIKKLKTNVINDRVYLTSIFYR